MNVPIGRAGVGQLATREIPVPAGDLGGSATSAGDRRIVKVRRPGNCGGSIAGKGWSDVRGNAIPTRTAGAGGEDGLPVDRGRRPQLRGHHQNRMLSASPSGARERRAAPRQRDPQVRLGFFRAEARPAPAQVSAYIDAHRGRFGVEPICRTLAIAPSTYYAARARPPRGGRLRIGSWSTRSTPPGPATGPCMAPARPGESCSVDASRSAATGWRAS